jgi:putative protease
MLEEEAASMAKQPELVTPAANLPEVERFLRAGAHAVVVGDERFGLRLPGRMTIEEIADAVQRVHERGGKLYVAVNGIFTNELADALPDYLCRVEESGADAIAFGDPAVVQAVREAGISLPLHWYGETLSTNCATANYWAARGATRVFAARELSLAELIALKRGCQAEVQVQVHGMTNIYHSKRPLVGLYRAHQGGAAADEAYGLDRELALIEAERPDERFPVYEDAGGTHIMSSDDLCYLEVLGELMAAGIDSFYAESLFKSVDYQETVLRIYRQAMDAWMRDPDDWLKERGLDELERQQPEDRPLSFGFLYKQQVY